MHNNLTLKNKKYFFDKIKNFKFGLSYQKAALNNLGKLTQNVINKTF